MTSVFISYSRRDKEAADHIAAELRKHDIDVFIDYQRLTAGENFIGRLGREIETCDFFILLFSPHSASSQWVQDEAAFARRCNKTIIPIILEPVEDMADWFFLVRLEQVDFSQWNRTGQTSEAIEKLLIALNAKFPTLDITFVTSENFQFITPETVSHLKEIRLRDENSEPVNVIAFSNDGNLLAAGARDGTIGLWETTKRIKVKTLEEHTEEITSVVFSPRDSMLVSACCEGKIVFWRMPSGRKLAMLDHGGKVDDLAFSPNGNLLVSSAHHNLKVWDVETKRPVVTKTSNPIFGGNNSIAVAFSKDGTLLASASVVATVVWHVPPEPPEQWAWKTQGMSRLMTLGGGICVAFSPTENILATSATEIKLWEMPTGDKPFTLTGHIDLVRFIDFSPDGRLLVSASWDKSIRLWDTSNGKCLKPIEQAHNDALSAAIFSPDGKLLASASQSQDNPLKLWAVS